jgi:ribonuclease HI
VLISPQERSTPLCDATTFLCDYVAEYEALINGLCIAAELGVQWLYIQGDSELVVN